MALPAETPADPLAPLEPYLGSLPVLPDLVMRLVTLDMNSDEAYDEVVSIAEEDPTFAARVLALANSAALAPGAPVTSIPQAIARIGAWRISELVSSMAVQDVFAARGDAARDLWIHSVETAVLCRGLADLVGGPAVPAGEAYLLGLVHDLGRSVLLTAEERSPELFAGYGSEDLARDEVLATGRLDVERERRCLGFDHAVVGGRAAERIGLGPELAARIAAHHEPGEDPLACLLYLAEGFSVHARLRPELFVADSPDRDALVLLAPRLLPEAWAGAPPLDLEAALDRVPELLTEAWHLTERLGG